MNTLRYEMILFETVTDRSISWEYEMSTYTSHSTEQQIRHWFCYNEKFFERLKVICRHLILHNNALYK